jgi:hypothetical protein
LEIVPVPIFFDCSCGAKLHVADTAAGQTVTCRKCQKRLTVPLSPTADDMTCPGCGTKLRVKDPTSGKRYKCPTCGSVVAIPSTAGPPVTPPTARSTPADVKTGGWATPPRATDYPRMKRGLAIILARQRARSILDIVGFGPSAGGRLSLVLIFSAVLFGLSIVLSAALGDSVMYGVVRAAAVFLAAFVPFLLLVLGPSDKELSARRDDLVAHLPEAEAAWMERKERQATERRRRERERAAQEAEEAEEDEREAEREERRERARLRAHEARRPSVVVIMPTKSVGLAVLLAFLFGPLGMLYSTVAGALLMLIISTIAAVFTCGFGLLITWPICIIWAAAAASSYNQNLLRGVRQY